MDTSLFRNMRMVSNRRVRNSNCGCQDSPKKHKTYPCQHAKQFKSHANIIFLHVDKIRLAEVCQHTWKPHVVNLPALSGQNGLLYA